MERKYYLRGLGVGIAVTAIIMGIALSGSQSMTDDEIIARARKLGMVENTVLADTDDEDTGEENADIQDETDRVEAAVNGQDHADGAAPVEGAEDRETEAGPDSKDSSQIEAAVAAKDNDQVQTPAAAKDNGEADTVSDVNDEEEKQTVDRAEDDDKADAAGNTNEIITSAAVKTITVNHGDGSYTVAKKLEDVGVVMSAATFDSFLCQNGYDKRLRTGTFSIPADASDEQIARIVTGAE